MDQFMVDVTGIEGIKIGDEVVILGEKDGLEITADEIAKVMDTINYEVVCLVSRRVPRVYIKNGKEIKTISYI
jgi:alanine racemase